jgi:glycosyltransferase involved in cell wall biosynthesis
LPGVINLGEVSEEDMNEVYRTSSIWCHPCNGGELYCMTGIKAQAANCVPVIIPTMALAETVRHGIRCTKENYAQKLATVVEDGGLQAYERGKLAKEHYPDWQDSTDALLAVIEKVLH